MFLVQKIPDEFPFCVGVLLASGVSCQGEEGRRDEGVDVLHLALLLL